MKIDTIHDLTEFDNLIETWVIGRYMTRFSL